MADAQAVQNAIAANNNKRLTELPKFCHLLHSEANGFMSMTLKKAKVAENDWKAHKEVFLSFFDIKGIAKLNFFSLHEMKQGPSEKVQGFWTMVQLHMEQIKDTIDVELIETLEQ